MAHGHAKAHEQGVHRRDGSHHGLELPTSFVPIVVLIEHEELLVVRVEQSLPLAVVLARVLLKLILDLLSLVAPDVDRVAALALAELAARGRQGGPSLEPRHLAQTAFAVLGEGLHAVAAAPVLHYELRPHYVLTLDAQIVFLHRQDHVFSKVLLVIMEILLVVVVSVLGGLGGEVVGGGFLRW